MAFIELHPELRHTNDLLERIACALERYLLEEYNVRLGHTIQPATDPNPAEKVTIDYASDEGTARQVLEKLELGIRRDNPDEEEQVWTEE